MKNEEKFVILMLAIMTMTALPNVFGVLQEAYVNKEYGFSIQPPEGWTIQEDWFGAIVCFIGPTEDDFAVNINIVSEETDMSLEEYVELSKQQIKDILNATIISGGSRTIKNHEAYEIVLTWTMGAHNLKQKQVYLIEKGRAYIITCTASQSNYDSYVSTFDESINTFEFLETGDLGWLLYVIIAVVIVIVAIAIIVYVKRRREVKGETEVPVDIQ